jgi:hypothetical protein
MIFVFPLGIVSKCYPEIVKENIASVSTTSGGYVFGGVKGMLTMWELLTIIRRDG